MITVRSSSFSFILHASNEFKSEVCLSAVSVLRTRGSHNLLSELRTVAAGIVSSTAKINESLVDCTQESKTGMVVTALPGGLLGVV